MAKETKEYSRIRKAKWVASLTPERRAELVARNVAVRSARRAAKALLEGRIPGKPGKKALPLEEKRIRYKAKIDKYRDANMDKIRIRDAKLHRECYPFNKEANRVHSRNRRARIKGAVGKHTKEDIKALFFEQKGLCGLCDMKLDADNFHVDHWKPLAKGGSNDKSNLKLLHPRCNLMKHDKDPMELRNKLISRSR